MHFPIDVYIMHGLNPELTIAIKKRTLLFSELNIQHIKIHFILSVVGSVPPRWLR